MALIQEVKDGKFVEDTSESSSASGSKKKNVDNTMGQDQFLQLLVAQMQYQDPLEPTSNTEWVAQMATFSMVESLNNMQSAFDKQSANALVGKYVFINDGDNGYVKGKVDYITKQDGKTKLSVNDKLYDLDKLDTVSDEEYFEGAVLANDLHKMIQLLPGENNVTLQDAGLVRSAREEYDKLTETQKKFVEKADLDKLTALEAKIDSFKATEFTTAVNGLPAVGAIEEADEETFNEYNTQFTKAKELYDNLTEKQRKLVAENIIDQYTAVEEAVNKGINKYKPSDSTAGSDGSQSDVSALLQKILDELQSQNKTGTDSADDTENTDSTEDGTASN